MASSSSRPVFIDAFTQTRDRRLIKQNCHPAVSLAPTDRQLDRVRPISTAAAIRKFSSAIDSSKFRCPANQVTRTVQVLLLAA